MLTEKVLIIGGSYFAGRSLVEFLANRKDREIFTFNRGNIPLNLEGVTEFHGNRTRQESIRTNLPLTDWDVVIDFCGYSAADVETLIQGIPGKIRHYIFISTVSVYDHDAVLPLDETSRILLNSQTEPEYAESEYIQGKIKAEESLISLCRGKTIPWTILRPSILYGRFNYAPRETYFFDLIQKEMPIIIPEHNLALFNFIFVKDLSHIIGLCINNKKAYDQVFNTVSPEFVSYKRFVEILETLTGKPLQTIEKSMHAIIEERIALPFPMDHHEVYSGQKLQQTLGFEFTPLAQGMKKTYDFYQFLRKKKEQQNGRL